MFWRNFDDFVIQERQLSQMDGASSDTVDFQGKFVSVGKRHKFG